MKQVFVPTWLVVERNRIIRTRLWNMIRCDILDRNVRTAWPYRSVLAMELRHMENAPTKPTWEEITVCIGFVSHSSTMAAASRYTAAEAEIKRREELRYG